MQIPPPPSKAAPTRGVEKKFFFQGPPGGAALLGGGWNPHFGGLMMSYQNETFHSLFLCYPGNFGEKNFFFRPPFLVLPYWGEGESAIFFGGVIFVRSKRNFS